MDIQYQVYPPSNSTWLQLLVFSLGSGYHFMALTLKHCYSVILCFLSGFFVVVGFFLFFFFWSCLSYTGFSAQDALPIAYIEKPKTYIYTSIRAYIDLFALCT